MVMASGLSKAEIFAGDLLSYLAFEILKLHHCVHRHNKDSHYIRGGDCSGGLCTHDPSRHGTAVGDTLCHLIVIHRHGPSGPDGSIQYWRRLYNQV